MWKKNALHIRAAGAGLFDIEIFPLGGDSTVRNTALSVEEVVDHLVTGPKTIEILSFDEKGQPVEFHGSVQAAMQRRGRTLVPSQPCADCGDTRVVGGGPCPACAVPWAFPQA
jgi:hypothetical protein